MDEAKPPAVGIRLREIRESQGLKQRFVAKRAGITSEQLSRIERAHSTPKTHTLLRICEALEVAPADVI